MKTASRLIVLCLAVAMAAGCSSSGSGVGPTYGTNAESLFPLAVGNTWTYQVVSHHTSGLTDTATQVLSIVDSKPLAGSTAFVMLNPSGQTAFYAYQNGGTDLVTLDTTNGQVRTQLMYRDPMTLGDTLVLLDSIVDAQYAERDVLILNILDTLVNTGTLTLHALKYTRIHFRSDLGSPLSVNSMEEDYLARGVGLVIAKTYGTNPFDPSQLIPVLEVRLQNYTLK